MLHREDDAEESIEALSASMVRMYRATEIFQMALRSPLPTKKGGRLYAILHQHRQIF